MISKMSHATIYVTDQEKALEFYRDKLGFKVINDVTMEGGFRWLTVAPQTQSDFEIVLMGIAPGPMFEQEAADKLRDLIEGGKLGAGVFNTPNCQATYEELSSRGVEFSEPLKDTDDGLRGFELKDRDGYVLFFGRPRS